MGIKDILQKQDKEAADAVMDTGHYRREAGVSHIKAIVKNPLNRLRIEFSEKFLGTKSKEDISEEYVRDLQNRLEPMFQDSEDKKAVFASHRENFEHFLQTGDLKTPLNLKDEESQFFWGTALALYAVRPEMQEKWDPVSYTHLDVYKRQLIVRLVPMAPPLKPDSLLTTFEFLLVVLE